MATSAKATSTARITPRRSIYVPNFVPNPRELLVPSSEYDYKVKAVGQLHGYFIAHSLHSCLAVKTFLVHPCLVQYRSWFGFVKALEQFKPRPVNYTDIVGPHYLQFSLQELPLEYANFPSWESVPIGRINLLRSLIRYHCLDKTSRDKYCASNPKTSAPHVVVGAYTSSALFEAVDTTLDYYFILDQKWIALYNLHSRTSIIWASDANNIADGRPRQVAIAPHKYRRETYSEKRKSGPTWSPFIYTQFADSCKKLQETLKVMFPRHPPSSNMQCGVIPFLSKPEDYEPPIGSCCNSIAFNPVSLNITIYPTRYHLYMGTWAIAPSLLGFPFLIITLFMVQPSLFSMWITHLDFFIFVEMSTFVL